MTRDELAKVIEKHEKWLKGEDCGERADLSGANLYGANLCVANLRCANFCGADLRCVNLCDANLYGANLCVADLSDVNLCGADLRCVNLCDANLYGADLRCANLYGANLINANLRGADLSGANLYGANLCVANLRCANFCGADLRCANLYGANLINANLRGAYLRDANLCGADLRCVNLCDAKNPPYIPVSCPDSGSFTAWKKANGYIVKLLIPEDARRSSATGRKCRCDKAQVLAIENVDGTPAGTNIVKSNYDRSFVYEVGKTVTSDFCEDRFIECAPGIHFFINRQEAVEWGRLNV